MGLVMAVAEAANMSCHFSQFQADLIQISLFFYLWPCKYTKTNLHIQTFQLRLKDLQFHNAYGFIPHNAPSKTFLCAWVITLFLDTQNNSVWGESTAMEATNLTHGGPISAADQHILHLCSHHAKPDTTIC